MPVLESIRDGEYPQYCTECGDELSVELTIDMGMTWKWLKCPKYQNTWWRRLFVISDSHDRRLINVSQDRGKFDAMTGERKNHGKSE